jgi:hypothetical protein
VNGKRVDAVAASISVLRCTDNLLGLGSYPAQLRNPAKELLPSSRHHRLRFYDASRYIIAFWQDESILGNNFASDSLFHTVIEQKATKEALVLRQLALFRVTWSELRPFSN